MCGPDILSVLDPEDIAALHVTPGEVSASPFGRADEIGMLNLMNSSSRATFMNMMDPSAVFDLAVDYFIGMPSATYYGDTPFQVWMSHTPHGTVIDDATGAGHSHNSHVAYSGESIMMYTHCGTHIDTLSHFGYHGKIWNGFSAAEHLGSRHWQVAGAEKLPPIISRGVLLDIPAMLGTEVLPDSYGIGEKDIRGALSRQGTTIRKGDVVLVRSGRMRAWPDVAGYIQDQPGLNREGAEFIARSGAIVVGADTLSVEQKPSADSTNRFPVHTYLLAEAGIPILEVVDLEALAQEGVYEFAFFAACMKVKGATGSPLRPIAIPLR